MTTLRTNQDRCYTREELHQLLDTILDFPIDWGEKSLGLIVKRGRVVRVLQSVSNDLKKEPGGQN